MTYVYIYQIDELQSIRYFQMMLLLDNYPVHTLNTSNNTYIWKQN